MVLRAGTLTSQEKRRSKRSRILRAPQCGFSRFRHAALDALWIGIMRKKVNWVLDADIRDFFGISKARMADQIRRAPHC